MSARPAALSAERSGLFRAPRGVAVLMKEAKAQGAEWRALALRGVSSKAQFLAACARQLGLPAHFGDNWDALADCLRDGDVIGNGGWVLHVRDAAGFAKAASEDYATALEILRFAADYWKEQGVLFLVLVDGDAALPAL